MLLLVLVNIEKSLCAGRDCLLCTPPKCRRSGSIWKVTLVRLDPAELRQQTVNVFLGMWNFLRPFRLSSPCSSAVSEYVENSVEEEESGVRASGKDVACCFRMNGCLR